MIRLVHRPVSFFGLALILIALPLWWRLRVSAVPAIAANAVLSWDAASAAEKQVTLKRAGLDAQTLAASGVTSGSISALVQALNAHLVLNPDAISGAETALANARRESDRLLRLIQAGKATQEQVGEYQVQKAALAAATAQHDSAFNAVFTATTAGLSQQQRETLSAIRANAANAEVSVEFRTITRTKQEWMQLRDDLANERISATEGVQANPSGQARLATARANATVAAATTALNTNLAAVAQALTTAVAAPSDH